MWFNSSNGSRIVPSSGRECWPSLCQSGPTLQGLTELKYFLSCQLRNSGGHILSDCAAAYRKIGHWQICRPAQVTPLLPSIPQFFTSVLWRWIPVSSALLGKVIMPKYFFLGIPIMGCSDNLLWRKQSLRLGRWLLKMLYSCKIPLSLASSSFGVRLLLNACLWSSSLASRDDITPAHSVSQLNSWMMQRTVNMLTWWPVSGWCRVTAVPGICRSLAELLTFYALKVSYKMTNIIAYSYYLMQLLKEL